MTYVEIFSNMFNFNHLDLNISTYTNNRHTLLQMNSFISIFFSLIQPRGNINISIKKRCSHAFACSKKWNESSKVLVLHRTWNSIQAWHFIDELELNLVRYTRYIVKFLVSIRMARSSEKIWTFFWFFVNDFIHIYYVKHTR